MYYVPRRVLVAIQKPAVIIGIIIDSISTTILWCLQDDLWGKSAKETGL